MASRNEEPQALSDFNISHTRGMKKTVIIGATNKPNRYAYFAAKKLTNNNHPILLLGIRKGQVLGVDIQDIRTKPTLRDVDTVTMYINPTRQAEWENYILSLQPKRIIFNPGTENQDLAAKAREQGIETLNACTLVMLSAGTY